MEFHLALRNVENRITSPKIPKQRPPTQHNPLLPMSSTSILRIASRAQPSTFFRSNGLRSLTPRSSNAIYAVPALIATSGSASSFSTSSRKLSGDGHHEESFEEFTARYARLCQMSIGSRGPSIGALRVILSMFLHSRDITDIVRC